VLQYLTNVLAVSPSSEQRGIKWEKDGAYIIYAKIKMIANKKQVIKKQINNKGVLMD
jgi:hypothetical protein